MSKAKELLRSVNERMDLSKCDISVLMDFAKKYNGLGGAVQEQMDDLLDSNFDGINPNAVDEIEELAKYHEDIESSIESYREWEKEQEG